LGVPLGTLYYLLYKMRILDCFAGSQWRRHTSSLRGLRAKRRGRSNPEKTTKTVHD